MNMQIFTCTKPRMKHKNKGWASLTIERYLNTLDNYEERVKLKGLLDSNPVFKNEFVTRLIQFDNLLDMLFNSDDNLKLVNVAVLVSDICVVPRSDNVDINNMYNYLLEDVLIDVYENVPVETSHAIIKQMDLAFKNLAFYPDVEKTLAEYL